MTFSFVVWADNQSGDAYHIEGLSYEGDAANVNSPPISASDFVVIDDEHQQGRWFGQVIEPQRNLALQGLSRDNPSNIAAMEKILAGQVESSIFLRQVYYYRIRLIGEVDLEFNRLKSVGRRPRAGARGRAAQWDEVIRYMDFPPLLSYEQPDSSLIGRLYGVDIPVAIDDRRLYYHVLVAGATGSGKSNTVANLVKVAQNYGMCVIIFDHKPDYQDIHQPNDEAHLFPRFSALGLEPQALPDVQYFSLFSRDDDRRRQNETQISIRASDLPRSMLSTAMFYRPGEELQRESFDTLLNQFVDDRRDPSTNQERPWTVQEFVDWENRLSDPQRNAAFNGNPPMAGVLQAMRRRLLARVPHWMDTLGNGQSQNSRSGTFANTNQRQQVQPQNYFVPSQHLRAGRIIVIRINTSGREYGLFLSYMLRSVYNLRRNRQIQFPILNIIDEAQDIFQSEREVRETATTAIYDVLRKGRSRQVGFVFSVQNAGQLPTTILNNLNSRIIHRQNTDEELKNAIPGAPKELLQSALSYGAGEALVSILGARGVVHAEMAPSPFMLTKDMPTTFGTMADQMAQQSNQDDD